MTWHDSLNGGDRPEFDRPRDGSLSAGYVLVGRDDDGLIVYHAVT